MGYFGRPPVRQPNEFYSCHCKRYERAGISTELEAVRIQIRQVEGVESTECIYLFQSWDTDVLQTTDFDEKGNRDAGIFPPLTNQ